MYDELKTSVKTNVYGKKEHKPFSFLFKDSLHYSFCKPINLVCLGFFLFVVSLSTDFCEYALDHHLVLHIILIFIVLALVFSIYESGFSFIVFRDSLNGCIMPPSPFGLKEILHHGTKDFTVIFVYVLIMMIVQFILGVLIKLQTNMFIIVILSLLYYFVGGFYIVFINLSLINLAIHNGELKSAFNHHDIKRLLQNIGILRLLIVLFICNFVDFLVFAIFSPDYILGMNIVLDLFMILVLTPALTLFTKRFLILAIMH